jgi:hypothetical protein
VGCVDLVRGGGGRRYTDSFSVSVWLLCVFHLSLLSLSTSWKPLLRALKEGRDKWNTHNKQTETENESVFRPHPLPSTQATQPTLDPIGPPT